MSCGGAIHVEVVYAEPLHAVAKTYRLEPPASVADVLRLAAEDASFAAVDLVTAAVGVFGRPVHPSAPLSDGDRVEIYRPLAADPKTARRARVRDARRKR